MDRCREPAYDVRPGPDTAHHQRFGQRHTECLGWIRAANTTVTLNATDMGSGVASITYRVGAGAPATISAATTSFAVTAQGTTTISYFAKDKSGNVETTKTVTVKLDNVGPAVATTFPAEGVSYNSGSWQNKCLSTTGAAATGMCGTSSDATSGISSVKYQLRRTLLTTVQCWTGSTWAACTDAYVATASGPTTQPGSWLIPLTYTQRGNNTYTFALTISATDVASNTTSSVRNFR
ncbi:MAG: OmpL47-type beta-barrel domain-containing protein [Nocardioidaceae bacterium]